MGGQDRASEEGARRGEEGAEGKASDLHDAPVAVDSAELPDQSPVYHAENASRYDRQRLIERYEEELDCRLIVVIDNIFPYGVTLLEDLLYDVENSSGKIHLLLDTLGGDGAAGVRLARAIQSRCSEFTVLIPNMAKSAGTLLAMGAHHLLMGPASDLGPIDPQLSTGDNHLVAAKDVIAAVEEATERIQQAPDTFPLHAALLSDVTGLMVQQARSALASTGDLAQAALESNPDRTPADVDALLKNVMAHLVDRPAEHSALVGPRAASQIGLPVITADQSSLQWKLLWRLWTKYFTLQMRAWEGRRASKLMSWPYS